ncbi:MAG TPA: hypothetical protein VIY49_23645 [Bryobacteraceae bacterium]
MTRARLAFWLAFWIVAAPCLLRADFSYRESTRINGDKKPVTFTRLIKGNRMAQIVKGQVVVIDLDKQNITQIDQTKKTYSVMTFDQMKEVMDKSSLGAQVKATVANVSVKTTGNTRNMGMLPAKETILTLTMQGGVTITVDTWMATVPGYDEVREFHRKLGEKLGYGFGSGMSLEGFAEVAKQMSKIDGAPVETTSQAVSVPGGQVLSQAATELSNFSSAPLEASRFDVPFGFKQVPVPSAAPAAAPTPAPSAAPTPISPAAPPTAPPVAPPAAPPAAH